MRNDINLFALLALLAFGAVAEGGSIVVTIKGYIRDSRAEDAAYEAHVDRVAHEHPQYHVRWALSAGD